PRRSSALTSAALDATAASSVTSNSSGSNSVPNSARRRSASACLRTEPNTVQPASSRTRVMPWPMPVETPVMTAHFLLLSAMTDLLLSLLDGNRERHELVEVRAQFGLLHAEQSRQVLRLQVVGDRFVVRLDIAKADVAIHRSQRDDRHAQAGDHVVVLDVLDLAANRVLVDGDGFRARRQAGQAWHAKARTEE